MKSVTVARNYAEALFAAGAAKGGGGGQAELFGALIDAVAGAVAADERIAVALESPRVSKGAKARILERALKSEAPAEFVRFLQAVVRRGRQGLFGEIAQQYLILLDKQLNRVHAGVTLAREPDARTEKEIVARLTKALGQDVRAHFRTDRNIVGGVVVRVGDRILDGSVRRRLMALKRRMLTGGGGGDRLQPIPHAQRHPVAPREPEIVLRRQVPLLEPRPGNSSLQANRAREPPRHRPFVRHRAERADPGPYLVEIPQVEGGPQFRSNRSARPDPSHPDGHKRDQFNQLPSALVADR